MRKREKILWYNCHSYHIDSIINLKKEVKISLVLSFFVMFKKFAINIYDNSISPVKLSEI